MAATLPEIFGNYTLRGIEEISLPVAVSWWPQTLAWKVVASVMLLLALRLAWRQWRRYRANRYRREALILLASWRGSESLQSTIGRLPALLRGVALQAYPRDEVTGLSGTEWLGFLERQCPGAGFAADHGRLLLTIAYQNPDVWELDERLAQALLLSCRTWIGKHRVTV
ncbi:MAG: hypothetical protein ACI9GW_001776 [Halieaceae bacterium]|jgi:hypothetical protein